MQIIPKTSIDFVGNRWKFISVSLAVVAVSAALLLTKGLIYGIDFTGGTVIQMTFEKPLVMRSLREALSAAGVPDANIQSFAKTNTFSIRLKADAETSAADIEKTVASLRQRLPESPFRVDSQEYVGPVVGKHLFRQALWAIVFSLFGIIVYVAFRFDNPVWGVAGVVALGHDVLGTLGLFSATGSEVDLLIVSACLTIAGYSINDTIVVFDRMRELMRLYRHEPLDVVINRSINETLSRTIITSLTVFMAVVILFFLGGKVIHNFAMAMMLGVFIGTYSSIAIAAPMVYEWYHRTRRPAQAPQAQFTRTGPKGGPKGVRKP